MRKYKVIKKFEFNDKIIRVGTILEQSEAEDGDYVDKKRKDLHYFTALWVENAPEYFEEIKKKPLLNSSYETH